MISGVCLSASRAISVLFLDDDTDTLFADRLLGKDEGMRVEITHDGYQAITLANILLPDVIVLDIGLRSRDGYEVARRLRASASTCKIPIVLASGYDSADDEVEANAIGCEARLVKPCSADVLFGIVRDLAAGRSDETIASTARASNE